MTFDAIDQMAVSTIRSLSIEAIQNLRILGTQVFLWVRRQWLMCFGTM